MGKGRKPDRVYDLEGRRLTGQPTKELLALARARPGCAIWAYQRPGPGGWWELASHTCAEDLITLVVVR